MSQDKDEKARKLAEALRANLKRRKEQARATTPPPEKPGKSGG